MGINFAPGVPAVGGAGSFDSLVVTGGTLQVGAFSATGIAITSAASGSGVTLTATGGTNESIKLTPKGSGVVAITGGITVTEVIYAAVDRGIQLGNGASFILSAGSSPAYLGINGNGYNLYLQSPKLSIGAGTGTPTYGLHLAPTSGLTANQTMLVQDATASTGITGIFFNAGANQGSNPILTVAGDTRLNGIKVASDVAGIASTIGLSNVTDTTLTNAYIVKGGQAATTPNTGWAKIYIETAVAWVPYWANATP